MIKQIDNIILLGTSHVAQNSADLIKKAIEDYSPKIVCIELDVNRFRSLMNPQNKKPTRKDRQRMKKEIGNFGFFFMRIAGYAQKKIGMKIDMQPGIDMKTAYLIAKEKNIPVSLIDQDIKKTMKKLSKLSFLKKLSLVKNLIFKSLKKENKKALNFDIKQVPDDKVILQMINLIKKEVPILYKILIGERNIFMSKKLLQLKQEEKGNILAVVGAGHVEGMTKYLKKKINNNSDENAISMSFNVNIEE